MVNIILNHLHVFTLLNPFSDLLLGNLFIYYLRRRTSSLLANMNEGECDECNEDYEV